MDAFKKLKSALEALEREERRKDNLADWQDPAAKKEYIAEYKRKRRESKLPESRKCPCCDQIKHKSRQWVVFRREEIVGVCSPAAGRARGKSKMGWCAVCRGCVMIHFKGTLWK